MSGLLSWFIDTMARTETLDLQFMADTPDVPLDGNEWAAIGEGDSMARDAGSNGREGRTDPQTGKLWGKSVR
jgi:hypothetical protein